GDTARRPSAGQTAPRATGERAPPPHRWSVRQRRAWAGAAEPRGHSRQWRTAGAATREGGSPLLNRAEWRGPRDPARRPPPLVRAPRADGRTGSPSRPARLPSRPPWPAGASRPGRAGDPSPARWRATSDPDT